LFEKNLAPAGFPFFPLTATRWSEEIDTELAALFGITVKAKKTLRCSKCGDEGHNAKTCPSQQQQTSVE
jgi:hypothetical protein